MTGESPGVKIKVGKESRSEDVARVRAVRKAVGEDVKLMVDANLRWTPAEAMARCRLLEDLDLYWMEEPLDADDVLGHEQLSRHTSIPIALGENLFNRHVFREYLARGAAAILQPDVGRVGITEWLRIAALAHSFNASVSPHLMMEIHVPSGVRDAQRAFRGAGSDAGTLSATPSANRRRLRGPSGAARPRRGLRPGQGQRLLSGEEHLAVKERAIGSVSPKKPSGRPVQPDSRAGRTAPPPQTD